MTNKAQLIEALSERLGDKKVASQAVDGLVDIIIRTVNKGEKVNITGFGVFEKRARAARTARNPRTGEAVRVKKTNVPAETAPTLNDFYEMMPLRNSELLFYQVGLTPAEAMDALERQFNSLKGFARWIIAQVHATVLGDPKIGMNAEFIAGIKLRDIHFDPEEIRAGKKMEMVTA